VQAISFFVQERPESCVPACVRMVLSSYGIQYTETEIYQGCQIDIDGTLPSAVVRYAQNLGFHAAALRLSGLTELQEQLTKTGSLPIVYVNLAPLLGVNVIHAVIVEVLDSTDPQQIHVIDPTCPPTGRRVWALGLFEIGWRLARHQIIMITPP